MKECLKERVPESPEIRVDKTGGSDEVEAGVTVQKVDEEAGDRGACDIMAGAQFSSPKDVNLAAVEVGGTSQDEAVTDFEGLGNIKKTNGGPESEGLRGDQERVLGVGPDGPAGLFISEDNLAQLVEGSGPGKGGQAQGDVGGKPAWAPSLGLRSKESVESECRTAQSGGVVGSWAKDESEEGGILMRANRGALLSFARGNGGAIGEGFQWRQGGQLK